MKSVAICTSATGRVASLRRRPSEDQSRIRLLVLAMCRLESEWRLARKSFFSAIFRLISLLGADSHQKKGSGHEVTFFHCYSVP